MARKTLAFAMLACLGLSLLAPAPAPARTFEGFTLAAKTGLALHNPFLLPEYRRGTALFMISPGLKLFENRLTLEGDIGISERLYRHDVDEWEWESWSSRRDTLFRTTRRIEEDSDIWSFYYAYKGVLNAGAWSFFAGHMVFVESHLERERGERLTEYTTSALDSMQVQSRSPIDHQYLWGYGSVLPVYGIARRFGRWSVQLQGAGLNSLQALLGVSLRPIRSIGPHK